jgi:hypothetical protein
MSSRDDWMKQTAPGPRTSVYTDNEEREEKQRDSDAAAMDKGGVYEDGKRRVRRKVPGQK